MLFAASFGDGILTLMLVFSLGIWGFGRFMRKFDTDGRVKGAAREGVVNLLGKWLK